jgi:hypothetical protein
VALTLLCTITGCGDSANSPATTDGETFLAFASNFSGYQSWSHAPATPADGAPQGVHDLGPATVYWNQPRPSGAKAFATGTIIVKQSDPGAVTLQIFAMVKRGGDYNSAGARNWEFFELQTVAEADPLILWRGVGPPNGESYGGDPNTCNSCHTLSASSDYVWSEVLQSM